MANALRQTPPDIRSEEIMKSFLVAFLVIFLAAVFEAPGVSGNEFKEREAKISQYKKWLDSLGSHGSQYWVRLDGKPRPHRLYLG